VVVFEYEIIKLYVYGNLTLTAAEHIVHVLLNKYEFKYSKLDKRRGKELNILTKVVSQGITCNWNFIFHQGIGYLAF
jgi:hypothetical protein